MGRVCHSSVISKRLVADSLANDCDPTAIAFDVDVRVMLALPCYAGCQTITRSLLDADERIRISVYDYDFGMWNARGVCPYFATYIHDML